MGVQNTTHAVIVEQGEQNVNKTSSIGLCDGGAGSPKYTNTPEIDTLPPPGVTRRVELLFESGAEGWVVWKNVSRYANELSIHTHTLARQFVPPAERGGGESVITLHYFYVGSNPQLSRH